MDATLLACLIVASIASCSAIAGSLAVHKHRSPYEGVLLGLFLGPLGVLLECWYPYMQRPPIDRDAWNSLRSMMTYQQAIHESSPRRSSTAE